MANLCVPARHNDRESDTIDQVGGDSEAMGGKRLRYSDLIKPSGLPGGTRGRVLSQCAGGAVHVAGDGYQDWH